MAHPERRDGSAACTNHREQPPGSYSLKKCNASYLFGKMRRLLPRVRLPPSKAPMIHSRSSGESVKLLFAEPVDGGRGGGARKERGNVSLQLVNRGTGYLAPSSPSSPSKNKTFLEKLKNGAASFLKSFIPLVGGERRKILSSYVQCSSCSGGEPAHTNVSMLLLQGAAASASPGPKAAPH